MDEEDGAVRLDVPELLQTITSTESIRSRSVQFKTEYLPASDKDVAAAKKVRLDRVRPNRAGQQ